MYVINMVRNGRKVRTVTRDRASDWRSICRTYAANGWTVTMHNIAESGATATVQRTDTNEQWSN
jgi:predicted lipoprotein with Yx(FWY)xxD motif